MRKDFERENSDAVNIYLRLRVRKGGAEYLLKKGKKINYYLSKSKKTLTTRFL